MCALDKEIRKLNIHEVGGLSDILDYNNDWQILMDIIPADLNSENPLDKKYTWEDVMLIENEARRVDGKSCTKILLEEWGTSGKVRPRLSTLRELLIKVQLFRAAEYVSELLKVPYPERPSDSSAAKVSAPDVDQLPLIPIVPTPQPEYHAPIQMPIVLPPSVYSTSNNEEQDPVQDQSTQPIITVPHDTSSKKPEFMNFPYSTLANVTNNFSIIVGEGACGTVYSGKFYSDVEKKVAVKRLDKQGMNTGLKKGQFQNEITTFSKLNHPNLINLLGFSCDGEFLCLIYPYMKNGSLCDNLAVKTKSLHWKSRLDIALGIANGIGYLHESELIHRDIKTANVLLDDRLLPKLSDFGLVRLSVSETGRTIMTNTVVGTECYMPSEAFNGEISEKMDVFGYGVILLELLTGLPPYNEHIQTSLADFIIEIDSNSSSEGTIDSLIDKTAGDWGGDWETGVSNPVYQLALNCLEDNKNNRPDMKSIIERLENIKKYTVR